MNAVRKLAICVILCIAAGFAVWHAMRKPTPATVTDSLPMVVATTSKEVPQTSLPTVTVIGKRLSAGEKIRFALQDAFVAARQWIASGEMDRASDQNG
jgi:hypothetical protein